MGVSAAVRACSEAVTNAGGRGVSLGRGLLPDVCAPEETAVPLLLTLAKERRDVWLALW